MKRNKISSSGQLDETEMAVHGRKIPLDYIQQQINNDQDQFRRISSDVEYEICQKKWSAWDLKD